MCRGVSETCVDVHLMSNNHTYWHAVVSRMVSITPRIVYSELCNPGKIDIAIKGCTKKSVNEASNQIPCNR